MVWHHRVVRWLITLLVVFMVSPATAGVFKQRDKNRAKRPPAPAVVEKAPAQPAKAEAPKKAPPKSAVATKGRPDDLTPKPKAKPKAKPKKDGDVVIVEDKEDDVIVKDDD